MCDVADSGGCGFDPGSVLSWRCIVAFGLGENGDQMPRPANEDKTHVGPARFLSCTLSVRMQIIESEYDNAGSVPISDIKRPSILI